MHDGQSMRGGKIDASFPLLRAAFIDESWSSSTLRPRSTCL
jgi:hypothetical protein